MKTWHIAALVIVGLIVAGIAYTMYEKKNSWRRDPMWRHAQRQLKSVGVPKTNSNIPGLGLGGVEPERPAAPNPDAWIRQYYPRDDPNIPEHL